MFFSVKILFEGSACEKSGEKNSLRMKQNVEKFETLQ